MLPFGAGITVGVVVTVCVALVIVAVVRWRRCRQSDCQPGTAKSDWQQEMEWDNSELNITVNPLDRDNFCDEEGEIEGVCQVPVDDDDDCVSSGDEVDTGPALREKQEKELEWDDSTLSY